jgi:hypothetical protein
MEFEMGIVSSLAYRVEFRRRRRLVKNVSLPDVAKEIRACPRPAIQPHRRRQIGNNQFSILLRWRVDGSHQ